MLDALVDPAVLRADRGDARPGRVDVQPGAVLARDRGELRDRSTAPVDVVPTAACTSTGVSPQRHRRPSPRAGRRRPWPGSSGRPPSGRGSRQPAHHHRLEQTSGPGGAVDGEAPAVRRRAGGPSVARCSAARRAVKVAVEAVSWMTPPPAPSRAKASGRPSARRSWSSTTCSSSVTAGLVAQIIPGRRCRWRGGHRGRRRGGVRGEVCEEARVLPVREPGHEHAVEIGEHGVEGLGLVGSVVGRAADTSPGCT